MYRLRKILIVFALATLLLGLASAEYKQVSILTTTNITGKDGGSGIYQRNAQNGWYYFDVKIDVASANTLIKGLEATFKYDNTIFTDVSLYSDNMPDNLLVPSDTWSQQAINAQAVVSGNETTFQFMKACGGDGVWTRNVGQYTLYTVKFRIKNNAATGAITVPFDQPAHAKVSGIAASGNITNLVTDHTFTIASDSTGPITSVTAGGYFKVNKTISLSTDETNNEATINYLIERDGASNITGVISGTGSLIITANASVFEPVTVSYRAIDFTGNLESATANTVYNMDTTIPTISNLSYTAAARSPQPGYNDVYVTFNVADGSGLLAGNPSVSVGGGSASKVSGSGVGQFVYHYTITGGEPNGNLVIGVNDLAGNAATGISLADAINIDRVGLSFEIGTTPNPAAFLTTATIIITANKDVMANTTPDVVVSPGNPAEWKLTLVSQRTFKYDYFVTGNGWTAVVPWLGSGSFSDDMSPTINNYSPTPNAAYIIVDTSIAFDITDNIRVASETVVITINNALVYKDSAEQKASSYNILLTPLTGGVEGWHVTVNPLFTFDHLLSTVTIDVFAQDGNSNSTQRTYIFTTDELLTAYVATTGNDTTGTGLPDKPYKTITYSLYQLQDSGMIKLYDGTYDDGAQVNVNKNTTIESDSGVSTSVTIAGNATHRIFNVLTGKTLGLNNLAIVSGSVTDLNGGGIYLASGSTLNLSSTIISGNTTNGDSTHGGAIYANGAGALAVNSLFIRNQAANSGGGIYGGGWDINKCLFTLNSATHGGVFSGLLGSDKWTINNSVFLKNTGNSSGGVLTGGQAEITNSIFNGNDSMNGGVFMSALISVENSTFVKNIDPFFQASVARSTQLTATNCIFWGNNSSIMLYCPLTTINYSDIQEAYSGVGTGNIFIDPYFVNLTEDDLHLKYNSPVIDTGTVNAVVNDIIDIPRGIYDGYDMGAYEYHGIYLTEVAPARASTGNIVTMDVTLRVRDWSHTPTDLVTLNLAMTPQAGGSPASYELIETDNSSPSFDYQVQFALVTLNYATTYGVTINVEMPGDTVADFYTLGIIGASQLKVLSRTVTINTPADYHGIAEGTAFVPGSKLKYTIVIMNEGETPAYSCSIKDLVPPSTHLYFGAGDAEAPTLNGNVNSIAYTGAADGAAAGSQVKFTFDNFLPGDIVTMNYTVTLD